MHPIDHGFRAHFFAWRGRLNRMRHFKRQLAAQHFQDDVDLPLLHALGTSALHALRLRSAQSAFAP